MWLLCDKISVKTYCYTIYDWIWVCGCDWGRERGKLVKRVFNLNLVLMVIFLYFLIVILAYVQRSKHIDVIFHYIRDVVANGYLIWIHYHLNLISRYEYEVSTEKFRSCRKTLNFDFGDYWACLVFVMIYSSLCIYYNFACINFVFIADVLRRWWFQHGFIHD